MYIYLAFAIILVTIGWQYGHQFCNWYKKNKTIWLSCTQVPCDSKNWLLGTLHNFPGFGEKGLQYMTEEGRKHHCTCWWLGPFLPVVIVHHPSAAKVLLKTDEPKQRLYLLLKPWLGDGILLSTGEKWLRNRRLLTPAFHFDILRHYINIYNEATNIILAKWLSASSGGKSVEICGDISLLTLNVILRCAFSSDVDVQRVQHPYVAAILEISVLIMDRSLNPLMYPDVMFNKLPSGRKQKRLLDIIHGMSDKVIKERKLVLSKSESERGDRRPLDFLDILLLARDENGSGLSDAEVRDEVDTFLFEGHDTTASAISWILYTLASHPDHQEKCRQEVLQIMNSKERKTIEWEDLHNIRHLTLCIKEAIRIHTPVPLIGRKIEQPVQIGDITFPEGTNFQVNIYSMNHNPNVWGEDHMEFKPERFERENIGNMDTFAYVPFSAGPRNCIGQNFAMNEIKVAVARILQRFKLEVDKNHEVKHEIELVMRAKNGIKLHFEHIQS